MSEFEREAFDKWLKEEGLDHCRLSSVIGWKAWQAARSQGGEVEPVGVIAHTSDARGDNPQAFVKWLFGGDETNLPNGTELYAGHPTAPTQGVPEGFIENWRHDSEELEALHKNFDDHGVPRHDIGYEVFSAWGRALRFAQSNHPGGEWVVQLRGEYLATRGIWERPNHCGYTNDIHEAGRYSEADAKKSEAMAPEKYKAVCLAQPPKDQAQEGE